MGFPPLFPAAILPKILASGNPLVPAPLPWYDEAIKQGGVPHAPHRCDANAFFQGLSPFGQQGPKKGRTREEVDQVTSWLTGYSPEEIAQMEQSDICYGDFFRKAPAMNPNRFLITGKICSVKVEEIEDPLMREIRYPDKLVDELARGKSLEKILRSPTPSPEQ